MWSGTGSDLFHPLSSYIDDLSELVLMSLELATIRVSQNISVVEQSEN
jgi:hypothetical protein